jgi:hypothetical protein
LPWSILERIEVVNITKNAASARPSLYDAFAFQLSLYTSHNLYRHAGTMHIQYGSLRQVMKTRINQSSYPPV